MSKKPVTRKPIFLPRSRPSVSNWSWPHWLRWLPRWFGWIPRCFAWLTLDVYSKAITTTITILLTGVALIVAWNVMGIHEENAQLTKKNLEHRINEVAAFSKKLEEQNNELKEQQKRHEKSEKERHATALDLYRKHVEQLQAANDLANTIHATDEKYRDAFFAMNQEFSIKGLHSTLLVSFLHTLLKRPSPRTKLDDELIATIREIVDAEGGTGVAFLKASDRFHETAKELRTKFTKDAKNATPEKRLELAKDLNEQLQLNSQRFDGELQPIRETKKKVRALYQKAVKISEQLEKEM
ncbi:MAG TPA: hypothetical protein VFE62_20200 [Gemmataceae bacterium]|nr:hypothetical protein [Gemmataceae bacterium]